MVRERADERRRPTPQEVVTWIREVRLREVPNPFLDASKIAAAERIRSSDTVFAPESGYVITSADSSVAFAPGSGEMSPCVSIGLFDPVTKVAAVGHFNVFNFPGSLDTILEDMLPNMTAEQRTRAFPRLKAVMVGGNETQVRSVGLVYYLLQMLDTRHIPVVAAEVLTDPYGEGEESRRVKESSRAFVIDTRNGGAIIPFKAQQRRGQRVNLRYSFPYYNPANPLQKVFDGRPSRPAA